MTDPDQPDELDRRVLATALRDAPDPPRAIDPDAVLAGRPRRRARVVVAPVLAAVAVLAVVALVLTLTHGTRRPQSVSEPRVDHGLVAPTLASLDRRNLLGTWRLVSLRKRDGTRKVAGGSLLHIQSSAVVTSCLGVAAYQADERTLAVADPFREGLGSRGTTCNRSRSGIELARLLSGQLMWSVRADQLTLQKGLRSVNLLRLTYPLTPAQRRHAIYRARAEAFGDLRGGAGRRSGPAPSWPAGLVQVSAAEMTGEEAAHYNGGSAVDGRALVIQLVGGTFSMVTRGPLQEPGDASGNVVTLVESASEYGEGISRQADVRPLPGGAVLYQR